MHPILPLQYIAVSFSNYSLCFIGSEEDFRIAIFFYLSKKSGFLFCALLSSFIDFFPLYYFAFFL